MNHRGTEFTEIINLLSGLTVDWDDPLQFDKAP